MHYSKYVLTFAIIALLFADAGCKKQTSAEAQQADFALPVKVQPATLHKVGESTEYISTIRSRNGSIIQPDVEGQVTRIYVHSGQQVSPGQPLLDIDPSKQTATVGTQEANYRSRLAAMEYYRREFERRSKLFADGVISRQEFEQAQQAYDTSKADVEAMEATIREQRVQLHYYLVKAPTAGVVGDIAVRVGDRVKVDTVLTTVDRGNDLEAYISIPDEKSHDVKLGTPVEVLDANGQPSLRTSISFISPRVDTATQLLLVKANVPADKGFRNDELVHVRLVWREQERTTIPVTAVSRLGGNTFAFVAQEKDGKTFAHQKPVKLGDIAGNDYVVLDGVNPGDKLITSGVQMLVDGMPIVPQS
ncbi:MAG TPA: efflux RND transporter periplasmic adaptor subunit [Candidatus Acidoferrales bacterium]|nr:efflux RND transporter periplasmic adaptor subunit [Candidatus Acidoferrales bacterium]